MRMVGNHTFNPCLALHSFRWHRVRHRATAALPRRDDWFNEIIALKMVLPEPRVISKQNLKNRQAVVVVVESVEACHHSC